MYEISAETGGKSPKRMLRALTDVDFSACCREREAVGSTFSLRHRGFLSRGRLSAILAL